MSNLEQQLQELNEELLYEMFLSIPINEMATLDGGIDVHNEDDSSIDVDQLKFAHFHWNGVHFKFSRKLPENVTQLRKLIAFKKEQTKLDDFELSKLVKILGSRPTRPKKTSARTVYEAVIDIWELLNNRTVDYID